jgi:exopolysaccharide production protein ExoQ
MSQSASAGFAFRPRKIGSLAEPAVYEQVFTWLVFWPLLTLAARRTVYFGGPPADALTFRYSFSSVGRDHANVYVTLLYLASFALIGHRQIWSVLLKNPLVLCCLVFAAASVLWSASPLITLQMWLGTSLCSLFACYLSARLTPERLMSLLIFIGVIAAALSILFAIFLPSYGISWIGEDHAWQGICNQKNEFGMSMAFLLTPIFFIGGHRRLLRTSYAMLLLFLIFMSQSRGAWLVTVGIFAFVGWLSLYRRLRQRESYLLVAATLALVVAIVAVGFTFLGPVTRLLGKDPSLTGRTGIYDEVFKSLLKRPLLGYGFGAFWVASNPESTRIGLTVNFPNIGYAENGILELGLQLGVLGVGVVMTMIGRGLLQAGRLIRSPFYSPRVGWYATILVLELLTNIDAGWLMTVNTLDWFLTVTACIGLAGEAQRACQCAGGLSDPAVHETLTYS